MQGEPRGMNADSVHWPKDEAWTQSTGTDWGEQINNIENNMDKSRGGEEGEKEKLRETSKLAETIN